jgi:hypothetical protein
MKLQLKDMASIGIALVLSAMFLADVSAQGKDSTGGQSGASGRGQGTSASQASTADRDRDRDRVQDQDCVDEPVQDRTQAGAQDRTRDRLQDQECDDGPDRYRIMLNDLPDIPDQNIYGLELMNQQERIRLREALQAMTSQEEVDAYMATHRNQMKMRAREKGMELAD